MYVCRHTTLLGREWHKAMAKKTYEVLIDDLDGVEIAEDDGETVQFAFRGRLYSLDLSKDNADAMGEAFAPYVTAAKDLGKVSAQSNGGHAQPRTIRLPSDANAVRAWAEANGHEVSARGRISQQVRSLYEAATAGY